MTAQIVINAARETGGLTFIAHPVDPPSETFGEEDLSWVDWDVQNFTGIEFPQRSLSQYFAC